MRINPGYQNIQRGEKIRKNLNVRQPSRIVRKWGRRERRPSGRNVIGTSRICSLNRLALMIISVANSMPVHCSSSRSNIARVKPRIPQ